MTTHARFWLSLAHAGAQCLCRMPRRAGEARRGASAQPGLSVAGGPGLPLTCPPAGGLALSRVVPARLRAAEFSTAGRAPELGGIAALHGLSHLVSFHPGSRRSSLSSAPAPCQGHATSSHVVSKRPRAVWLPRLMAFFPLSLPHC